MLNKRSKWNWETIKKNSWMWENNRQIKYWMRKLRMNNWDTEKADAWAKLSFNRSIGSRKGWMRAMELKIWKWKKSSIKAKWRIAWL